MVAVSFGEYAYVLLACVGIAFEYYLLTYAITVLGRTRAFNRAFMDRFNKEHSAAFPSQKTAPDFGYPDTGSGKYSRQLDYKSWVNYNNCVRVQMNFLEQLPMMLVFTAVFGIAFPKYAAYNGLSYVIGRLLYSIGYM